MNFYRIIFVLLLIGSAALYSNKNQIENLYRRFFGILPQIEKVVEQKVEEVKKEVNTPPPLRAKQEYPQAFLTLDGVVKFTNLQRAQNNLPPLSNNSLLDQSALKKVQDMFNKQYFEHTSPEGKNVEDLVKETGYEFITIGENLALGNFLSDEVLLAAWMDSPGHRANILNSKYKEIGVAVLKGTYQGRVTWIAVQHFGKPLSACPQPDGNLNQTVQNNLNRLDELQKELDERKRELEEKRSRGDSDYNQKVNEYNGLVEEYNRLAEETKNLVEEYNNQIRSFNSCASS